VAEDTEYRRSVQAREREKRRDYYRTYEVRHIRHRLEKCHNCSFTLGDTVSMLANNLCPWA
jgi:hypothetical protein